MIDLLRGPDKFVAFVGAGASVLSPSNLPTWTQFNDLLLESLCDSLDEYSQHRQPTRDMLKVFRARRDETHYFAPDFQAQLMEEEIGADYFRVWQSLETDHFGPVHRSLAQLASSGKLAAIITTNFDRLNEKALDAEGIAYSVLHNREAFDRFASASNAATCPLPILKIHGSIEDTSSLIDTLRQRVAGTPKSLLKIIQTLLVEHPWLYLGFSGADFSYNRHYLGILDAASAAKGFVFLTREGTELQKGVRDIAEAYGPEKSNIVRGDLATWLIESFQLPSRVDDTDAKATSNATRFAHVKQHIGNWTSTLGQIAIVNILYSMLRSSGMDAEALWLMRKTWKSYRTESDPNNKSYSRYNYNYGLSLVEAGFIGNPITLAEDVRNYYEWKDHADQNAFEFFARSYQFRKFLPAGAQLASVLAYRGQVAKGLSLLAAVHDEVMTQEKNLDTCDVAIAGIGLYDILRLFDPVSAQLKACLKLTEQFGDELRRAALCAHLGRFMTYGGHFEEATFYLDEADRIGNRLDLRSTLLISKAARGRWFSDSGTSDATAMTLLSEAAEQIRSVDEIPLFFKSDLLTDSKPAPIRGHHPSLCRVLLDLNRAARFGNDVRIMNQTLDELDEIATQVFTGYTPHYYLAYAECLLSHGNEDSKDLIVDLLQRARSIGTSSGNPWVADATAQLETQIPR